LLAHGRRSPLNTRRSVWTVSALAQPKHTVPTGLPGTAPVGPAMPVVETAMWALLEPSAPLAMAAATSSDTLPIWAISAADTSSSSVLEALE
jgi:hypothetical protein